MNRRFRNILVIQLGDIGDVVVATPAFRAFRETYPDARVSVLVRKGYGSLLQGDPHLHEVLEVAKSRSKLLEAFENFRLAARLRRTRYDLVFDLRTGDRGTILAFLVRAPAKVSFGGDGASWRRYVFTRLIRQDELTVAPSRARHRGNRSPGSPPRRRGRGDRGSRPSRVQARRRRQQADELPREGHRPLEQACPGRVDRIENREDGGGGEFLHVPHPVDQESRFLPFMLHDDDELPLRRRRRRLLPGRKDPTEIEASLRKSSRTSSSGEIPLGDTIPITSRSY